MRDKIIYFIRHGESVDATLPIFQSKNSPLSTKGISQAQNVASRLKDIDFDLLVSSTMRRAKESASYISSSSNKGVLNSDLFIEPIRPDGIDGKPRQDAKVRKLRNDWKKTLYEPNSERIGSGENYDAIMSRTQSALDFLAERPEEAIVVVAHGYFIRSIIAKALFGDELTSRTLKKFQDSTDMNNGAVSIIERRRFNDGSYIWSLLVLNDTSHMNQ